MNGYYLAKQSVVRINRQFWMENRTDRRQVPGPLSYYYIGRKPLHEVLVDAERVGSSECVGRDCAVYLFKGVGWPLKRDLVYHLDKSSGTPLRVETYRNESDRQSKDPGSLWTVESIERIQGRDIPAKSAVREFANGKPVFTWNVSTESIAFDKTYPETTFWLTIEPGVMVMDAIRDTHTTTPGGEPPAKTAPGQTTSVAIANPAVPPTGGPAMLSRISLGLSGRT